MQPTENIEEVELALENAADLICKAERVAVLTGAGISAESGLATFRGAGGLWEGQRVEQVATPRAFAREPQLVWRFYNHRRANLRSVQPNPGHHALVELEKRKGDGFTLVTQNVDGLHQAAGNKRVLEIHGALRRVRCLACGKIEDRGTEALPDLPACSCGALLRPDIVWFEENLPDDIWSAAEEAVRACQCFLVVGTSAVVYPAAGLILQAKESDAAVVEINLTATDASRHADVCLHGPSGVMLPNLMKRMKL